MASKIFDVIEKLTSVPDKIFQNFTDYVSFLRDNNLKFVFDRAKQIFNNSRMNYIRLIKFQSTKCFLEEKLIKIK